MPKLLGKKPPKIDPRTFMFAKYVTTTLPPVPKAIDWTGNQKNWGELANDRVGDCTCASAGHMIECWTSNLGQEQLVTNQDVLAAYSAVSGYDPATGANDNGAVCLDVLNYWRKQGIGGHKIQVYTKLNHNLDHIKLAIDLFGGIYAGFSLPISAQKEKVWTSTSGKKGAWGGHAVPLVSFDEKTVTCITWGKPLQMTWPFVKKYMDESYAIISPDWFKDDKAPNGFDLQALQADLQSL
jgi:hypothetical protein